MAVSSRDVKALVVAAQFFDGLSVSGTDSVISLLITGDLVVLGRYALLWWPLRRKSRSPDLNAGRAPLRRRCHRRSGRRAGALNVYCSLRRARREQARGVGARNSHDESRAW